MTNKKIFYYLNKLSLKLNLNLVVLLLSIAIYTLWYLCGIEDLLSFSYIHISLGHIGYIGLLFLPAFLIIENNYLQKWWIFFSGLALLDLPTLVFITNGKPIENSIFFSSISLTILFFLFLISTLYAISVPIKNKNLVVGKKDLYVVFISSLFFMIVYHGMNLYLKVIKDIPNQERSFYIGGLEFHHINYGIILLILIPFIYKYTTKLSGAYSFLSYIFIGFIYGTVFDEAFYYMLQDVSDDAYFHSIPIIASLSITLFSFIFWRYSFLKKKGEKNA
jgi:hypothetical protein